MAAGTLDDVGGDRQSVHRSLVVAEAFLRGRAGPQPANAQNLPGLGVCLRQVFAAGATIFFSNALGFFGLFARRASARPQAFGAGGPPSGRMLMAREARAGAG